MSQAGNAQRRRSRTPSRHAKTPHTRNLTPAERQFLVLLHDTYYGSITDLVVRAGQPILDPLPYVMREITFKESGATRKRAFPEDFALKEQVVQLFRMMEEVRDGLIRRLEVKGGLPFRVYIEGASQHIVHLFLQDGKDGTP